MTPVLYFGEEEWKEHHYLSDIMNVVPNMWKSIINDWYTRVIDIKKIDTTLFRNKDNKDLFEGILKIYNAKGKSDEIKDLKVTKEIAVLISTITGMKDLVNIIMEQESEEIDMCRSWELFKENEIRIPLEREIKRVREEGRIAVEKELKLAVEKELHETKATIIITILNDKLGGLSKELQQHLKEISIEKLDIITKQILHIENEQDILSLTN